ncbi:MAG: molybdopterin-dependent oxidoreductase [Planctomycetota bacterium]
MTTLRISGEVGSDGQHEWTHDDLFAADAHARVENIGSLVPGRRGSGVRFEWLVERSAPAADAAWVELESSDGSFTACLAREDLASAVLVHADGDRPFDERDGGPFRLYVPDAGDRCGNVKHLARVGFLREPVDDSRPPVEERDC